MGVGSHRRRVVRSRGRDRDVARHRPASTRVGLCQSPRARRAVLAWPGDRRRRGSAGALFVLSATRSLSGRPSIRVIPSDAAVGQIVILAFLGLAIAATYVLARWWARGGGAVVAAVLV